MAWLHSTGAGSKQQQHRRYTADALTSHKSTLTLSKGFWPACLPYLSDLAHLAQEHPLTKSTIDIIRIVCDHYQLLAIPILAF